MQSRWTTLTLLVMAAMLSACVQKQQPQPQPEQPKPVKWQEIKGDAISFVRAHPNAAHKNTYIDWKHYEHPETKATIWKANGQELPADAQKALDELVASVDKDLIASDGIYACRYRENMPQYRLTFSRNDKTYAVISSSDCQYGAPYNVRINGSWYMQLSGATGKALEAALQMSDVSLKIGTTPAVFHLANPIQIQKFEGTANASPLAHFDALFRADATFGGALKYFESLFGTLKLPEVACNQAKSDSCSDVSARYTIDIMPSVIYQQAIQFNAGLVNAQFPTQPEFEMLAKARDNIGLKAYAAAYGQITPIEVSWHDGGDCKMVKGLAKHFELPENLSCSYWQFNAKDLPTGIYYNGLKSFWIAPHPQSATYLEKICADTALPKSAKTKLCKKNNPQDAILEGTNIFLRSDGNVLKFVTKEGVTRIE